LEAGAGPADAASAQEDVTMKIQEYELRLFISGLIDGRLLPLWIERNK
jgi:hypothetical protein